MILRTGSTQRSRTRWEGPRSLPLITFLTVKSLFQLWISETVECLSGCPLSLGGGHRLFNSAWIIHTKAGRKVCNILFVLEGNSEGLWVAKMIHRVLLWETRHFCLVAGFIFGGWRGDSSISEGWDWQNLLLECVADPWGFLSLSDPSFHSVEEFHYRMMRFHLMWISAIYRFYGIYQTNTSHQQG